LFSFLLLSTVEKRFESSACVSLVPQIRIERRIAIRLSAMPNCSRAGKDYVYNHGNAQ
jgi:hypothetical protein